MPDRRPIDPKTNGPASSDTTAGSPHDTRAGARAPGAGAVPKRIGRYEVRRLLGEGAFGRVYLALDPQLGRPVAIKLPKPEGFTRDMRERFLLEARAAATIHHPNVCPVHDVGVDGDVPYIVMHYQAGITLADHLERGGPLEPRHAALLAQRLALGVAAAHDKGVIHRDLKPQNILFDPARHLALITDFGLARVGRPAATADGAVCGTPAYMSPEQARGRQSAVGPASDVYSLGVILFRMLTGDVPFVGRVFEVLAQHAMAAPPAPSAVRPGIDPRLDAIVLKALAKDPADRYPTAKALADALAAFAAADGSSAAHPVAAARPKPPVESASTVRNSVARPAAPAPAPATAVSAPAPHRQPLVGAAIAGAVALGVVALALSVGGRKRAEPTTAPPPVSPAAAGPEAKAPDAKAPDATGLDAKAPTEDPASKLSEAERQSLGRQYNRHGDDHRFGTGVKRDYAKAREWYAKGAALGYAPAQQNLAFLYERGLGGEQDYVKANELYAKSRWWYEKEAAAGDATAQLLLGYQYDNGFGGEQNRAKAKEWYEKAVAQGNASAMNSLGFMYANGHGVPVDYAKAREWYETAAAKGNESSQGNLGDFYHHGRGVPLDYTKAREWYEKAATRDNAVALYGLGVLYEYGHGVPRDVPRALSYYERAVAQGHRSAVEALERLKKQ